MNGSKSEHVNELRKELLDQRANQLNRWLAVVAIVLTTFGLVVPLVGIVSFDRFNDVVSTAEVTAKEAKTSSDEAKREVISAKRLAAKARADASSADAIATRAYATVSKAHSLLSDAERSAETVRGRAEDIDGLVEMATREAASTAKQEAANAVAEHVNGLYRVVADVEQKYDVINEVTRLMNADVLSEVFHALGRVSHKEKELDRALRLYDLAIRANPDFALAYYSRGMLFVDRRSFEFAKQDFTHAIGRNGDLAKAYLERGMVNAKLGKKEDALADLMQAIEKGRKIDDSSTVSRATLLSATLR